MKTAERLPEKPRPPVVARGPGPRLRIQNWQAIPVTIQQGETTPCPQWTRPKRGNSSRIFRNGPLTSDHRSAYSVTLPITPARLFVGQQLNRLQTARVQPQNPERKRTVQKSQICGNVRGFYPQVQLCAKLIRPGNPILHRAWYTWGAWSENWHRTRLCRSVRV